MKQYYDGEIEFILHRNSELGLEKDFFAYMSQGISVDYAVVAPSHMSTFSKAAPLMDMPFLFRDLDHWNKVLDSDALQPIADEVLEKADVMLIGYAGGGVRNLIVNKPVTNMSELKDLPIRVMGAPIQTGFLMQLEQLRRLLRTLRFTMRFKRVIDAAENEAAGHVADEVLRSGTGNRHYTACDHRTPLCFSGKTF